MFILIAGKIVNSDGSTAFELQIVGELGRVHAVRADDHITCGTPDDARACFQDLAERLHAERWDHNAKVFVPVTYNPNAIARIFQYLSHDGFPASSVDDVLTLVSLMNSSKESDIEVSEFIKMVREKYFDTNWLDDELQEQDEGPPVLLAQGGEEL